ncbi:integral membrane sensor signal transduction histidine kinase [Denitrovibrio acetiphilus DSM 12809]|uniref:histidine kinase n=1 Tax=Denitrovibrio acetiphilus (strain DSM 12809 / NBRC 114555 / N2460) TaxID=522772 RepID=D4H5T1_DENA2|nr:PAS domain-containing sensor histidine kinase [Denitrovibrio acetiphilus]ADD69522.1 integral membrane sensor signal transduction histidine kinase [Denitrovibrio acetiphilus DSM 12809]
MIRYFILLILAAFIFSSVGVATLVYKGSTDVTQTQRDIDDAKASVILTGRFVEHLINERFEKLYSAAYAGDTTEILRALVSYTDFVAAAYGHRGAFTVGLMDSGFSVINSISSGTSVCPEGSIVNEEIAERLLNGDFYVGPVLSECAAEKDKGDAYLMFAVPVYNNNKFYGVVYEISTILDSVNSYKLLDYFSEEVSSRIILDDALHYKRDSENYRLLQLKGSLPDGDIVREGQKLIGFYSFYYGDIKLCLIYIRDNFVESFSFDCCPWVEKNKLLVFSSPLILLVILAILEMVHVNEKLGREIRERTEHLESMQKRYQRLFEIIPEYIVLYRQDGEIIECNGRFAQLLKGGNPIGANINFMIREKKRFAKMVSVVVKKGSAVPAEFLLAGRMSQVSVSIHSCIVDLDDKPAILSVMTDLTDYKKMQNTYYLAQKREVVGTIAAGMVHDFSNILQNISLQYSLMERSDADSHKEHMAKIKTILDGANKYLTSVLSYTKDTKDRYEIKSGREFVRNAVEMVESVLPADVLVEYVDAAGDIKIKAMQAKITQALINLCQNASDAMGGKGIIYVSTYVEKKPFGHFFCLSVKDSGVGIPPDVMDHIYKPFFTTKSERGTGLGLATVKQITLDMGGFIDVNSKSGEGTEFILMFSESK